MNINGSALDQTDTAVETQALADHSFLLRNPGNGGKRKLLDTHRFPLFCVSRQHLKTQTQSQRRGQGQVPRTEGRGFMSSDSDAHRHLESLYGSLRFTRIFLVGKMKLFPCCYGGNSPLEAVLTQSNDNVLDIFQSGYVQSKPPQ